MKLRTIKLITIILALAGPSWAEQETRPGPQDDRIRMVNYAEHDVVAIHGHYGFSTTIEFAPNETITTVSVGDSEAWQVVKPNQPNLLFVKPILREAYTNMSVITDRRIYVFSLEGHAARSRQPDDMTFHIRFRYPDDVAAGLAFQEREAERLERSLIKASGPTTPEEWNFNYTFSGSDRLRPLRTFDDGRFTYFSFPEHLPTPAIFMVNSDRTESIVNYQQRGPYIVVERLGTQFTLRDGPDAVCIFNESFPEPEFDQLAPLSVAERKQIERAVAEGPGEFNELAGGPSGQGDQGSTITSRTLAKSEVDSILTSAGGAND